MYEFIYFFFFCFHRKKEQDNTLDYCKSRIECNKVSARKKHDTSIFELSRSIKKKVLMSEKHKEMEQKALDIMITFLGISPYPGILMFKWHIRENCINIFSIYLNSIWYCFSSFYFSYFFPQRFQMNLLKYLTNVMNRLSMV